MKRMKKLLMIAIVIALIIPNTAIYAESGISEEDMLNAVEREPEGDEELGFKVECRPRIEIEKKAYDAAGNEKNEFALNEPITFKVSVKNTGDVKLGAFKFDDALLGLDGYVEYKDLSVGQTTEFTLGTKSYSEPQIVTNEVSVKSYYKEYYRFMGMWFWYWKSGDEDTTDVTVTVIPDPSINVVKTPVESMSPEAARQEQWGLGDDVIYRIKVENDGNWPLTNVHVIDYDLDNATAQIGDLAPGQVVYVYFTGVYDTLGEKYNKVEGFGDYSVPALEMSGTVDEMGDDTVWILPDPDVSLMKESVVPESNDRTRNNWDRYDWVTYKFTITNTGDVPLHELKLTDSTIGYEETDFNGYLPLMPGESVVKYESEYMDTGAATFDNTATVDAVFVYDAYMTPVQFDEFGFDRVPGYEYDDIEVSATADHTITINQPDIRVEKVVKDSDGVEETVFFEDETATYEFTVTNSGEMTLFDVHLYDPMFFGPEGYLVGMLQPGDDEVVAMTFDLSDDGFDGYYSLHNIAWVEGYKHLQLVDLRPVDIDPYTDPIAYDDDGASIYVGPNPNPELELDKMAPAWVMKGTDVDYDFDITNTGDVPIYLSELVDTLLPDSPYVIDEVIDPQETYSMSEVLGTADVEVLKDAADMLYNTATVYGESYQKIHMEAFEPIQFGQQIVTTVMDDDEDWIMFPSVSVQAEDSAEVFIKEYGLEVTKEADKDPEVYEVGDTVTFTITMKNTGNVDLETIWIEDFDSEGNDLILMSDILDHGLSAGLDVNEEKTLTVSHVYNNDTGYDGILNEVFIYGFEEEVLQEGDSEPEGRGPCCDVMASADELIHVWFYDRPMIEIEKTVDKEIAVIGEEVTYTFVITNSGNISFQDVTFSDDVLGISNVSKGSLGSGDSMTFTETTTFWAPADDLVNTATAVGYYNQPVQLPANGVEPPSHEPGTVMDEDTAMLDVILPSIQLEKTAVEGNESSLERTVWPEDDRIWYELVITNTSLITLYDIEVNDPDIDEFWDSDVDLAPGESYTIWMSEPYFSPGEFTNTATARGYVFPTYDDEKPTDLLYDGYKESGVNEISVGELFVEDTDSATVTVTDEPDYKPDTPEEEILPEDIPEALPEALPVPVDLTVVVTGEGNIISFVKNYDDVGAVYTFGPLVGVGDYKFVSIGGPDGADLIMVSVNEFDLVMDGNKEIHILFQEPVVSEDDEIFDEVLPEASPIPATGGTPMAVPFIAGAFSIVAGFVLKKKK